MVDLFDSNVLKNGHTYHPKYLRVCKDPYYKELISKWGSRYHDKDNNFVEKFQTRFHPAFWELYLSEVFQSLDFKLITDYNSPDFIIDKGDYNVLFEAVTANIKQYGRLESSRDFHDVLDAFKPPFSRDDYYYELHDSIARFSNAFLEKESKYESYKKHEHVKSDDPYVVAMGSYSQVNYGSDYIYGIVALLYKQYMTSDMEYIHKNNIIKNGTPDSTIELGLFTDDKHANISAVLYSCTATIGKLTMELLSNNTEYTGSCVYSLFEDIYSHNPMDKYQIVTSNNGYKEPIEKGLFVFHNPYAKNPLPLSFFGNAYVTQIYLDDNGGLSFFGNPMLLMRRYNVPNRRIQTVEPALYLGLHQYQNMNELLPFKDDTFFGLL